MKQKAQEFLNHLSNGDSRCDIVIMMLCQMFNITTQVAYDKIKELAEC